MISLVMIQSTLYKQLTVCSLITSNERLSSLGEEDATPRLFILVIVPININLFPSLSVKPFTIRVSYLVFYDFYYLLMIFVFEFSVLRFATLTYIVLYIRKM
ncbi:hypothetical protein SAY86_002054 [Trapa natans]|uniref:Uncharacterized protein n=1 Tax=Trapa natans TaxID=22666 RepID=A0AAN7LQ02_TRANT|nr:hypothetical protein SAY86_002054 [Trapa natans]